MTISFSQAQSNHDNASPEEGEECTTCSAYLNDDGDCATCKGQEAKEEALEQLRQALNALSNVDTLAGSVGINISGSISSELENGMDIVEALEEVQKELEGVSDEMWGE